MKIRRDTKTLRERGARLIWTREALDVGQAELAKFLEISPQRMNNYEAGLRPFDVDLALTMTKRWKLSLEWLYDGDDSRLPKDIAERIAERRKVHERAKGKVK
jgi:transcriptional regulator with XRE-family HTH domain